MIQAKQFKKCRKIPWTQTQTNSGIDMTEVNNWDMISLLLFLHAGWGCFWSVENCTNKCKFCKTSPKYSCVVVHYVSLLLKTNIGPYTGILMTPFVPAQ